MKAAQLNIKTVRLFMQKSYKLIGNVYVLHHRVSDLRAQSYPGARANVTDLHMTFF